MTDHLIQSTSFVGVAPLPYQIPTFNAPLIANHYPIIGKGPVDLTASSPGSFDVGDYIEYPINSINLIQGTFYLEVDLDSWASSNDIISGLMTTDDTYGIIITDSSTNTAHGPAITYTPGELYKISIRYGNDKMKIVINGEEGTESTFVDFSGLTQFIIGGNISGSIHNIKHWSGTIFKTSELIPLTSTY